MCACVCGVRVFDYFRRDCAYKRRKPTGAAVRNTVMSPTPAGVDRLLASATLDASSARLSKLQN